MVQIGIYYKEMTMKCKTILSISVLLMLIFSNPISNALASYNPFTLTTTGTSGAATLTAGVLNVPQYANSTFQASMATEQQLALGGL